MPLVLWRQYAGLMSQKEKKRKDQLPSCDEYSTILGPYRKTIAGSPPHERIYFFFEKIKFASQKLNLSIFVFQQKKSIKMTLNSLEVKKCCKKEFILFLFFCLQNFLFFTFLFLKLFLGEPAMVLRYSTRAAFND